MSEVLFLMLLKMAGLVILVYMFSPVRKISLIVTVGCIASYLLCYSGKL